MEHFLILDLYLSVVLESLNTIRDREPSMNKRDWRNTKLEKNISSKMRSRVWTGLYQRDQVLS